MSPSRPKGFHPFLSPLWDWHPTLPPVYHGLFGIGHSIKSSATIQQMEGCTLFLCHTNSWPVSRAGATNASLKAMPVLLSHPLFHLSALSSRKLSSIFRQIALLIAFPRQGCHPVTCSTCSPVLPPHALRSILPSVGRMFGWPYTSPSLPSQGLCSNGPRTCAPHRRRIREVGSLPLDLAIVSYFNFRVKQKRAPLVETWLLVPRKITSWKHEPQATALWPARGEPRLNIELPYLSVSRLVETYFARRCELQEAVGTKAAYHLPPGLQQGCAIRASRAAAETRSAPISVSRSQIAVRRELSILRAGV